MKLDIPNDSQRLLMLSHERRMNFVPMPLKLFDQRSGNLLRQKVMFTTLR